MRSSFSTLTLFLLVPTLSAYTGTTEKGPEQIPFPAALADAAIRVESLSNIIDDALIIGNGDINALIYSVDRAVMMTLTKNDVWDARLETYRDPPLPTLDLIKRLGRSETAFPLTDNNRDFVLPEGETWQGPDSYSAKPYPCPRQCARICIGEMVSLKAAKEMNAQPIQKGELDLRRAVAIIRGPNGGPRRAEIRALADRNAFLIDAPDPVYLLPVPSEDIPPADAGDTDGVSWLKQTIPGDLDWPGMAFAVAIASKGSQKTVAIVTSLESSDVVGGAIALAKQTLETKRESLIQNHESEWNRFWSLSGIEIDDKRLQRTWYRSLYFLRCVSKPGVQSVGLFAGLINDTPAWHGDYHTNYNLQQTYWSAFPTNHPDLAEPYDRLILEYLRRAKWLSQRVYGIEGAYYPHVLYAFEPPDPTTCKSRNGRQYVHHTWGMTIGVNGFSIQPVWWRYKYDPDGDRLKKIAYPALRAVALFYAQFIEQCNGGQTVRLGPSVSPEHWGWTKQLERNYNCPFDIAMARYTLNAAIEAAQTLERDEDLIEKFRKALQRLPHYPLHGGNEPVVVDVEGAPPITYNIPVPATPVFPGDVVTWWSPEQEKELFARTIEGLQWNGNNATFMLAVSRARLSMPDTQAWLGAEIEARTRPNGIISLNRLTPHHPFNDFGHYTEQFGAGMAISELFVQSVGDILRLFPALAPGCRARFANLRTQGGFLVTADGALNAVESLQIESLYGGTLRLLSPWRKTEARRTTDDSYQALDLDNNGVVTVATQAGETWYFRGIS